MPQTAFWFAFRESFNALCVLSPEKSVNWKKSPTAKWTGKFDLHGRSLASVEIMFW
jgi:hypothetical protein